MKIPNFRERFEVWHQANFGYCVEPNKPFTALTVKYQNSSQQNRWEGWQGNSDNSYQLGRNAGEAHYKKTIYQQKENHENTTQTRRTHQGLG